MATLEQQLANAADTYYDYDRYMRMNFDDLDEDDEDDGCEPEYC